MTRTIRKLVDAIRAELKGKTDLEIYDLLHEIDSRLWNAMSHDGTIEAAIKARRAEERKARKARQQERHQTGEVVR